VSVNITVVIYDVIMDQWKPVREDGLLPELHDRTLHLSSV
jgi:hypothetical protein